MNTAYQTNLHVFYGSDVGTYSFRARAGIFEDPGAYGVEYVRQTGTIANPSRSKIASMVGSLVASNGLERGRRPTRSNAA